MSVETEVTYESPWRPKDEAHPNSMTLASFCEKHGLITEFLPFEYIKRDLLSDMCDIHEFLETRLVTKQMVSTSNIYDAKGVDITYYPHPRRFLNSTALLIGWWDADYTSYNGRYLASPVYPHLNERFTVKPEDRKEFFEYAASLGLDYTVIAPALGVDSKQPRKSCHYRAQAAGVDYSTLKRRGWLNLIRTWKTSRSWGYSYHEIGKAFNRPAKTVRNRVGEYAGDFDPPDEPSLERYQ